MLSVSTRIAPRAHLRCVAGGDACAPSRAHFCCSIKPWREVGDSTPFRKSVTNMFVSSLFPRRKSPWSMMNAGIVVRGKRGRHTHPLGRARALTVSSLRAGSWNVQRGPHAVKWRARVRPHSSALTSGRTTPGRYHIYAVRAGPFVPSWLSCCAAIGIARDTCPPRVG